MTEEVKRSLPATSAIKVEPALIETSDTEMGDKPSQSVTTADRGLEGSNFVNSPEVSPTELSPPPPGPSLAGNARVARDVDTLVAGCNGSSESKNSSSSSTCPAPAASPPNFLTVPVAAASSPASTANGQVMVKSEPRDDIKDYVETTMNELLGWYGLPKMDKGDTPSVSLAGYPVHLPIAASHASPPAATAPNQRRRKPSSSSSSKPPPPPPSPANSSKSKGEDKKRAAPSASPSLPSYSPPCADSGPRVGAKNSNDTNNNSSHNSSHNGSHNSSHNSSHNGSRNSSKTDGQVGYEDEEDDLDSYDNQMPGSDEEDTGDEMAHLRDSPSVRSDVSGMISPLGGISESDRGTFIVCSWCQKPGTKLYTLKTSSGVKAFCSEVCFTQCRRASFKKKKVCDWCKHVRHTVNFVDFQEGDVQLQFCSEKCLNQYKMNIFCTEANQHLQHIQSISGEEDKRAEVGKAEVRQGELLITPELWLSGNSNESNVSVKEEVEDEKNDNEDERSRECVKGFTKLDEAEEPGEVRDKCSALDGTNRLAFSDDSSCSFDDKSGANVSPLRLHRSRPELLHLASSRLQLRPEDLHRPVGDARQRKDPGKSRKPLADHKSRSASTDQVSAHPTRRDSHLFSHVHSSDVASTVGALQGEAQASNPLLPDWASFQLLSMMPPHLNTGLNLGSSGYATNPLLYSNLFGVSHLAGATEKDTQAKLRHESRRELLRDRDRFTDHNDRKKDIREKPIVPSSPSTSLSSTDTSGPASHVLGLPPPSTIHPNMFSELARHFPHTSAFLGEVNQPNPLSHYLSNAALPGMLPFPINLNQPQNHRPVLTTPAATAAPAPSTSHQQTSAPPQQPLQFAGVPPITIMVPYPVAVPIPLPIPIPIPISPEKLFAYFREKSESGRPAKHQSNVSAQRARSPEDSRPRATSASHLASSLSALSPRPASKCSSVSGVRLGSTPAPTESPEPGLIIPTGRESADSIMTLRREITRSQLKAASTSPCTSSSIKVMITPGMLPYMLDLSKSASQESPRNEDEAMDLSKMSSRSDSPRRSTDSSEKENKSSLKRETMSDTDAGDSQPTRDVKVPRIHIVSEPPDPPLSQPPGCIPLPMPPEQSSYSSRRSRILDAPSVPKKSRSPSPERRYIRTVPRELVEAARRRGLRARVRSK